MKAIVVKIGPSIERIRGENDQAGRLIDKSEKSTDFEHILELARFGATRARHSVLWAQQHREILKQRGEPKWRLHELDRWRESAAFTKRERAALNLSENISLRPTEEIVGHALSEARLCFTISEVIGITLAITALNDWLDLRSDPQKRVLLVEDNPYDQELLLRQLANIDVEKNVVFVSDAGQALDLLLGYEGESFRSELVALFLDIRLPGMSGIELLERIRIVPGLEDLPVVVMTSSSDPRDIEECQRLKVVSYVQKPVTTSSFFDALARVFYQSGVSRGKEQLPKKTAVLETGV